MISMLVAENESQTVLTATENGYGKRTPISEYTRHGRGTKGMIAIQTGERNGSLVGAVLVEEKDEVMLISTGGVVIRTRVAQIREQGRSTQGVTLINLDAGTRLAGIEKVLESDEEGGGGNGGGKWQQRGKGHSGSRLTRNACCAKSALTLHTYERTIVARTFNFSAGPAVLPETVLQQAAAEMLDWHGSGMSVMEMSHRGKEFISIHAEAEKDLRELLAVPANYKVLFLQGGAIAENAIVPMNLLRGHKVADYVNTGEWSKKSIKEAKKYCSVNVAASSEDRNFTYIPPQPSWKLSPRCGLRPHLLQRNHRRRRVPLGARYRRRAAGGRHVLAHPVAPGRRGEIRPDLRRRAEEHRAGGADARDRARRPDRPGRGVHAVGVRLQAAGRGRFHAEHAADLCHLYRRAGVQVAESSRAGSPRSSSATSPRPSCCTTTSTRANSSSARSRRATARA